MSVQCSTLRGILMESTPIPVELSCGKGGSKALVAEPDLADDKHRQMHRMQDAYRSLGRRSAASLGICRKRTQETSQSHPW